MKIANQLESEKTLMERDLTNSKDDFEFSSNYDNVKEEFKGDKIKDVDKLKNNW